MPLEPRISRFSSRSTVNDVSTLLTTPAPPLENGRLSVLCPFLFPRVISKNSSSSGTYVSHSGCKYVCSACYRSSLPTGGGRGRCWGARGCSTAHAVHRPFSRSFGHWNHAQKAFHHSLLQNISMSILSIWGNYNFMFKSIIWKVFGYV